MGVGAVLKAWARSSAPWRLPRQLPPQAATHYLLLTTYYSLLTAYYLLLATCRDSLNDMLFLLTRRAAHEVALNATSWTGQKSGSTSTTEGLLTTFLVLIYPPHPLPPTPSTPHTPYASHLSVLSGRFGVACFLALSAQRCWLCHKLRGSS